MWISVSNIPFTNIVLLGKFWNFKNRKKYKENNSRYQEINNL